MGNSDDVLDETARDKSKLLMGDNFWFKKGLSLFAKILVIILRDRLQREIGRNWDNISRACTFGIRIRFVRLSSFRRKPMLKKRWTAEMVESFTVSQYR